MRDFQSVYQSELSGTYGINKMVGLISDHRIMVKGYITVGIFIIST